MAAKKIALKLQNISFSYNKKDNTIRSFSLEVEEGSFTTLLGPSGCGKTTLLRLISGFLEPTEGLIEQDGINQKGIMPDKRKIGMVFQDYALFPHLNVKKNILFGLNINEKKLSKSEKDKKVQDIAETLGLSDLLNRFPHELSGGQQQRVALARALVLNPKILLMDEPLSSLDSKLRIKVREELKQIQKLLHITTIYVTHDQEEALSLSDSIAIINEGKLLQYDSPREIYFKPSDPFTADFIGCANFLTINDENFMIRPEWFSLNKTTTKGDIEGIVLASSFLGDKTRFQVKCSDTKIITVDLQTLETNFLEPGISVSLNINNKWKMN